MLDQGEIFIQVGEVECFGMLFLRKIKGLSRNRGCWFRVYLRAPSCLQLSRIQDLVELFAREVMLILRGAVAVAVGMNESRKNSISETSSVAVLHVYNRMILRKELGELLIPTAQRMKLGALEVKVEKVFLNKPRVLLDKPRVVHEDQVLHIIEPIFKLHPMKNPQFPCVEVWTKHPLDDLCGVRILHQDCNPECNSHLTVEYRPQFLCQKFSEFDEDGGEIPVWTREYEEYTDLKEVIHGSLPVDFHELYLSLVTWTRWDWWWDCCLSGRSTWR